jgi:hypothetical protein
MEMTGVMRPNSGNYEKHEDCSILKAAHLLLNCGNIAIQIQENT